jgi:hypothetical protein
MLIILVDMEFNKIIKTLENTEGAIKNRQSRETSNDEK